MWQIFFHVVYIWALFFIAMRFGRRMERKEHPRIVEVDRQPFDMSDINNEGQ